MKACVLRAPGPVETGPLLFTEASDPEPSRGEVLVRVRACGVCRTDLHVVEGDLPPRHAEVIPGHQAVGVVERAGEGASRFRPGDRVGIPWLHRTCGACEHCRRGRENLCDAADFTGYTVNGGYAEAAVVPERFAYPLPAVFDDLHAAPLLCAGIIGYRSLKVAGLERGRRLGFYGFGAAAHLAIQVARQVGAEVFAVTRDPERQRQALALGAVWAGTPSDRLPAKLHSAIVFAPAGEVVPPALRALEKGGAVVLAGIHMTPIPPIEYLWIYEERSIRSVANNTRADGEEFLAIAAEIPIRSEITAFPLAESNRALAAVKHGRLTGSAVLTMC